MNSDLPQKAEEKALEYLDEIMVPPLQQVGGIIADQVKFWRYKNQVRILEKAKSFHEKHGISPKKIPVKTIASFMEYSSLEEDETIQEMWAKLFANATDSSNEYKSHHTLVNILKELTSNEVKVLQYMWNESSFQGEKHIKSFYKNIVWEMLTKDRKSFPYNINDRIVDKENELILDNLIRLNIIQTETPEIQRGRKDTSEENKIKYIESRSIRFTALGFKLIQECNFPKNIENRS